MGGGGQGEGGTVSSRAAALSGLLDASVIVRYLLEEPSELATLAAGIIDSDEELGVTDGALLETAWVLNSVYRLPRAVVVDSLVDFLARANISTVNLDKGLMLQALLLCRPSQRVSFADALLWAAALSTSQRRVYSFDERFPSAGIEVRRGR
jgi:predicted nucleic acid-binding protein